MLEGSTAPHCRHVFVTGCFCAADASTPVRRERLENSTKAEKSSLHWREEVANQSAKGAERSTKIQLRFHLLGEHVSTERDAALEGDRREVRTLAALCLRPGAQRR